MRKREREITLLYGFSIIRDDVLKHPLPELSTTDRALIAAHFMMKLISLACLAMPLVIMIISLIP